MEKENLRKMVNAMSNLKTAHLSTNSEKWWYIECTDLDGEKFIICDQRYWNNYTDIVSALKKKVEQHEDR